MQRTMFAPPLASEGLATTSVPRVAKLPAATLVRFLVRLL
jgi:hypothetical protein